ncbi:AAA family ATPase [Vibrio sp. S9_S30]|uniref:AAA family ATPase n=1 Tax=Vibrio sp. S9_S30 TaxID=2720226 RepID=UPI00167FF094|nr:AAA family ATPase [Vibrio sp. S9_S30]MBD1558409.1 AAA family ATPase [Vibrio sp. S9_S30]
MSLAHEMRVLELETQTELLDRVQLLTRFGSNLINITGDAGSGKTWLAQRYLEAWASEKNQSLLLCFPTQSDEQQRAMMLNQIVSDPLFNEHDSIIDSFSRLVGDEACDVVFVVDDAELLSEDLLAELWMLVIEAQNHPQWTVNVVLFSKGDSLEHILTRISYGQETKPIDFEIEPLSSEEAIAFTEALVIRYTAGEEAKKKVRKSIAKTQRLPGQLMELGNKKVERRVIIRSVIESPIRIAIVVLLLILLIGGGYWWYLSQPTLLDGIDAANTGDASQSMATEVDSVSNGSGDKQASEGNLDDVTADNESKTRDDRSDDFAALPPQVTDQTAEVGRSDAGKRVVVPSDVVDALLQDERPPQTVTIIDDAIEDAKTDAIAREQLSQQPSEEAETASQELAPKPITFSYSREELSAVSSRNYTLQLAALTSKEEVQDFIDLHQIQEGVRIYPTVRNGVEWFIVTYKDFPTIQQARDAVSELSADVQALGPWAKSMIQVQREIERGK